MSLLDLEDSYSSSFFYGWDLGVKSTNMDNEN